MDLETGAVSGLELTEQHGAKQLVRHPLEPGGIAVADRIPARRTDLGQVPRHGVDLVVRIGWLTTPLTVPTERPVRVQTPTGAYSPSSAPPCWPATSAGASRSPATPGSTTAPPRVVAGAGMPAGTPPASPPSTAPSRRAPSSASARPCVATRAVPHPAVLTRRPTLATSSVPTART